jgi:hypothetical protein
MPRRERIPVALPLLLSTSDGDPPVVGVSLDLQERGGIGYLSPRPFTVGQALQVELVLPGAAAPLRMAAQVVWCDRLVGSGPLVYRCGARLLAIGVRDALLLQRYLVAPAPVHHAA